MKSIKSGFARAIAPYLQKIDLLTPRIYYQNKMHDFLWDAKGKVFWGQLQRIAHLFDHQVNLSFI